MSGDLLKLLISAESELNVLGHNSLNTVLGGASVQQLEQLHGHVLEDASHEDASGGANLLGVKKSYLTSILLVVVFVLALA